MITDQLKVLENQKKLEKSIVLWGIGRQTKEIITWFKQNGYGERLLFIVDNFKCTFHHKYEGIPVVDPKEIEKLEKGSFIVILSINYAEDVWRQLGAYGGRRSIIFAIRRKRWYHTDVRTYRSFSG